MVGNKKHFFLTRIIYFLMVEKGDSMLAWTI